MMIKYIVAYLIFSYFVNLLITAYIFKYDKDVLFNKAIKQDLPVLTLFSIFWGFSPIMLPIVIIIMIKNKIVEMIKK